MATAGGSDSARSWTFDGRICKQILSSGYQQEPGFGSMCSIKSVNGDDALIQPKFDVDDAAVSALLENLLKTGAGEGFLQESLKSVAANARREDDSSGCRNIQQMRELDVETLALVPFSDFMPSSSCHTYASPSFHTQHLLAPHWPDDMAFFPDMIEQSDPFTRTQAVHFDSLQKQQKTGADFEALLGCDVSVLYSILSDDEDLQEELDRIEIEPFMINSKESAHFDIEGSTGEGFEQSQSLMLVASESLGKYGVLKKFHNKRAKYQHLYLLEGKSQGISSMASELPASSTSQGVPSNVQGQQPSSSVSSDTFSLLSTPNGDKEYIETENGDDEDKDGENRKANDVWKVGMDLSDDLLHKVFSFLNDTSLCRAAMVCRQWRASSAHEDFWKLLNFENRKVTHDQVLRLCAKYPKALELNLRGVQCVDEVLVRGALHSMRGLQTLVLGRGTFSDGIFHALEAECSLLKSLSISDAVLGNGGSQEIQFRHDSLCKLHIVKCRVLRIAIRCPHLESLSLKRTGTASAVLNCPLLVSLDVSSCHKLSDAGVRAAATACPLLASLDLSNCSYVSDDTLRDISNACRHLRYLDASYCPNISLEGVHLPMLIDMKLQGCEGINASSMTALSFCVRLEALELDFCWLLTSVALDLPQLKSISLSNCRKFVELTLRSPLLASIVLTNCPALNRINITSYTLQRLQLSQQQALTTITLHCPSLREVDLTECDSLNNSVCGIFSDGGGCSRLSSLVLDNCEGLTAVRLSTNSLRTLSLIGCRNIDTVDLACPNLESIHLDGCDRLASASFHPVGLQALNLGICPRLASLSIDAPAMTALDLRGCGDLMHADVFCPSLSSLDASYCSRLTDDFLAATTSACPLIESLVLASCPSIESNGLLALKLLSSLKVLDLSYTFLTELCAVYEACPRLEVLKLSACKSLADDALDALHGSNALPHLIELDLSYGTLGRFAIEELLSNCPHLVHVNLNGCANVYDLHWNSYALGSSGSDFTGVTNQFLDVATGDFCKGSSEKMKESLTFYGDRVAETHSFYPKIENEEPGQVSHTQLIPPHALQSLNCVGCPNIKRVIIPHSSCCLHLSFLNLSLSSNIREVNLSCANLLTLNLSNCVALEELKLDCPRLSSLSVQACGLGAEQLEKAIEACAMLETLDIRNCFKVQVTVSALSRLRLLCPMLKRLYSTSL